MPGPSIQTIATRCGPACRRPSQAGGSRAGYPTDAALPMSALWRSHDRHRGVRTRLRAQVAANASHDRHVITQASCQRSTFPRSDAWLYAGGDLSRLNHIDQCSHRPLTRSERPKCLLDSADLPCVQTRRCRRASVPPTIELRADIKSP